MPWALLQPRLSAAGGGCSFGQPLACIPWQWRSGDPVCVDQMRPGPWGSRGRDLCWAGRRSGEAEEEVSLLQDGLMGSSGGWKPSQYTQETGTHCGELQACSKASSSSLRLSSTPLLTMERSK